MQTTNDTKPKDISVLVMPVDICPALQVFRKAEMIKTTALLGQHVSILGPVRPGRPDGCGRRTAAGMFPTACARGGCKPRQFAPVGDSLESDVAGANGIGAVSVWLNRNGRPNDSEVGRTTGSDL